MDYDFMTSFLGAPRWGPNLKPPKPIPDPLDVFCNPQKLDVALRTDYVDSFRRYISARSIAHGLQGEFTYDSRYELFISTQGIGPLSKMKEDTTFLPQVLLKIFEISHADRIVHRVDIDRNIRRALDVVHENAKLQIDYNLSVMTEDCHKQVSSEKAMFLGRLRTLAPEIPALIEAYYLFSEVVDAIPGGLIPSGVSKPESVADRIEAILAWGANKAEIPLYGLKFFWTADICVIEVSGDQYLLPRPAIVEVQNKIADHLSSLLYAWIARGTYLEDSSYADTLKFIKALHARHATYPKSFFSVGGAIEAVNNAILVARHDVWAKGPNEEFLDSVLTDLAASCRSVGDPPLSTSSPLVQAMLKATTPLTAEMSCLSKISGHPITSVIDAVKKTHERTTRHRTIKVNAVAYTTQSIKKEFLKEHFTDTGEYPPNITFDPSCNTRLSSAIRLGRDIDDPSLDCYGVYKMEDFAAIHIGQFESLDYLDNIMPYLKDTASSITQSRVWKDYIKNNSQPDRKDMRFQKILLMYVMGSPEEIDHVTFAHEFERYESHIEDFMEQFAMRMVEKEKEMKSIARLFVCMTYKMRAINQIVLRFMQRYLRRYCSSQAMVVTELELAQKLAAFSKKKNLGEGMRAFTVCIDAEGWNNAFTKETVTAPLRETIDAMLGSMMVSRIHEAFEYTIFYAQEKGRVIYYHGQGGGCEGLQQGSWMLVYVHQIRYALRDCPYDYDILIKGDDARVRFEIPKSRARPGEEEDLCSNLRGHLVDGLAEFGHKIKTLDSYYSENVLVFSKKIFVEDVPLPSSFRQIQKTYGANNKFMATTDDLVGSAYSNAHSAAGYGVNVLAPYIVALFWSSIHILRVPAYRKLSDVELLALMLAPSALGGFPVIYLHNMFVRAESDLVSSFCGLALYCRDIKRPLYTQLKKIINYPVSRRLPWALLVADPYALPRVGYANPTATLESALKRKLRERAVNPVIKHLFSKGVDQFKAEFVAAVTSADIYDAKLVNAVAECTDFAVQERFLQKFVSAKTMIEHIWSITEKQREIRQLCARLTREGKLRDRQRSELVSYRTGAKVGVNADDYECPTFLAEDLRNKGWGKRIDGITYPPTQHQIRIITEEEVRFQDVTRCFVYEVKEGEQISPFMPSPHFHRSKLDPYLGHYTPSGTIGAPLDLDTQDVLVRIIRKLLMLSTMCLLEDTDDQPSGTFTMYDLIIYLLSRFTSLSIEDLDALVNKRKSGTRTHHLPARGFRVGIIPNMTKNLMSHIQSQVNTFRELRITGENYRINFLHLFCHTSVMLHFNWFFPSPTMNIGGFRALIPDCKDCFVPILEENMYMTDNTILLNCSDLPENLVSEAEHANELIRVAMESDERENDVRVVEDFGEPSEDIACSVVASEFFASTLIHQSRMTLGFRVIRPTVERMKDVVMLKGKAKRNRDITGSELAKIPSRMLMETLRETIINHVYSVRSLCQENAIHAAFMIEDSRSLPWATCVHQLVRHGKIQSLIAETCEFAGLPVSAGSNASRDYGSASAFLGSILATKNLAELPTSSRYIRVGKFCKSADIHLQVCNKRIARLVWMCSRFPMLSIQEEMGEFGDWRGYTTAVMGILLLSTGPTWRVEEIREMFSITDSTVEVDLIAEIRDTWYGKGDIAQLERRVGMEHRGILDNWLDASWYTWEDVAKYLAAEEGGIMEDMEGHMNGQDPFDITVKVSFLDLSECYQTVRAMEVPAELDDYGVPSQSEAEYEDMPSCTLKNRKMREFENVWPVPMCAMDFGPDPGNMIGASLPADRIDFTHLSRPYGWTSSAWVKLAKILDCYGVLERWKYSAMNVGCFADGDGGDSRWVVENFPNAIVVWNSLNESLAERISAPLAARKRDIEQEIMSTHDRMRYVTQMMETGDLTKDYITRLLCEEVKHYSIVKQDAELPNDSTREPVARKIWMNVLKIWLRRGLRHSILIEKVFTDIPHSLGWFMAIARTHSKTCHLVTLKESHCSFEAYLVCTGPVGTLPMATPFESPPSPIQKIAYEAKSHCETIIRYCSQGVSRREMLLDLPSRVLGDSIPPPRCIGSLAAFGVTLVDLRRASRVIIRIQEVVANMELQIAGENIELHHHRVVSDSITHSLVITEQLVFGWTILAVAEHLGFEVNQVRRSLTVQTKARIWSTCSEKLSILTGSPRFMGVGGPFNLSSDKTFYRTAGTDEVHEGHSLKYRRQFAAGLKTGLEFVSYVLAQGGAEGMMVRDHEMRERGRNATPSWVDN